MDLPLSLLATEALVAMYENGDADLKRKLLEGSTWHELKRRADFLTDISKELSKRRVPNNKVSISDSEIRISD